MKASTLLKKSPARNVSSSSLSLYLQVEERLREEIASGRLKEGDPIPSEHELAGKFEVSQGTVRKAILNMTQQGIFYRKQGKGTFVVFDKASHRRYRNFRFVEGLNSELLNVHLDSFKVRTIPAEGEVAGHLQLRKGTKILCLERTGKIADRFLIHTLSYLPQSLYKGLEKYTDDLLRNTLWKLQEVYFGVRVGKREEFVSITAADKVMAKNLRIECGKPVMRIELKLTAFNGSMVEYRISHCDTDHVKFYSG